MGSSSLTKAIVKKIHEIVDRTYDRAITRFLARPPVDKKLYIGVTKPRVTLPDLFRAASAEERAVADKNVLERLLDIAESYVEAQRHATKAKVVKAVEDWLGQAHTLGVKTDLETVLGGQLVDVWNQATNGMHKIVSAESNNAKNMGSLDGIIKVNAASGVNDPVVAFLVVNDDSLCLEENEEVISSTGKAIKVGELKVGDILANPTRPSNRGGNKVTAVSKKLEETVRLVFDNKKTVICTPDHPIAIRAGDTFTFIEAKRLMSYHDVVFVEDLNSKGERQRFTHSLRPRPFMKGYASQWRFWKDHIDEFLLELRTTGSRTSLMDRYSISIPEWDKIVKPVLSAYDEEYGEWRA